MVRLLFRQSFCGDCRELLFRQFGFLAVVDGEGTLHTNLSMLAENFRGLAGPREPFDHDLFSFVVAQYGNTILERFIADNSTFLSTNAPGLLAFLQSASARSLDLETVWSAELGYLDSVLSRSGCDSNNILTVAMLTAWRLSCFGVMGEWEARVPLFERLRVGEYVLPPAQFLHVTRSPNTLSILQIDTKNQTNTITFVRDDTNTWIPSNNLDLAARLSRNRIVDNVCFLTEGISECLRHTYITDSVLPTEHVDDAIILHNQALKFLDEFAPEFSIWVRRVLRGIIPLVKKDGGINSGSSREEPGIVHASINCSAEAYAEMLVHECSHQYYYVMRRIGPVDDGTDAKLYYSPVKRTGRPISMILLAFHAFANVVLMGRSCLGRGYGDNKSYLTKNEAFLLPMLDTLQSGLAETTALTPLGKALWLPLAERLRAA